MAPFPTVDSSLPLAIEGYGWLPNRRRRADGDMVRTRLLGQPAVGICGPEAARFFYDENHIRRHGAIPEPVQGTLFGKRAVHTMDGSAHRRRKELFGLLMDPAGITRLVDLTTAAWDVAVSSWAGRDEVVLFDDVPRVLTRGVCQWTGVPLEEGEVGPLAADLMALVDGFATAGPRHWRARRARGRLQDRLGALVEAVRDGQTEAPADSALAAVAAHRDLDGSPLDRELAAVELLNVLRPTVAVTWFVTFAGHALHRWPEHRARLRSGDSRFVEAFTHEVRRFYPFAPFVGGTAVRDLTFHGAPIPEGAMVLLDLYGQNHDPDLWPDPYAFHPDRFVDRAVGEFDLVPQGGGDPRTGHRCPGEKITVALLSALVVRLARLDYTVPEQDLSIPLHRIPTLPRSGVRITDVRPADRPGPAGHSVIGSPI
ncbi:cytochrome P450 [Plantactinospora sp. GCM10030261]|uniref:cytochrome P450 n=1 Tax=Plantactinospora sp. GCM10030261 TaxID=3273420 RepID=UPI00360867A2